MPLKPHQAKENPVRQNLKRMKDSMMHDKFHNLEYLSRKKHAFIISKSETPAPVPSLRVHNEE